MDQNTIRQLLDQYPTPLYVFEERILKERVQYLRAHLPEGIGLCYAVKANPFLGRFLADGVDRFEICSPGEMYLCEKQGLPADRFVLSGVYKDEESMRYAFEHGLWKGRLTVESVQQFELLDSLAEEYRQPVRVLLRLTSGNQFGMSEPELMELLHRIEQNRDQSLIMLAGIQFFSGTQKTSLKKHRRELALLDDLLDRIREETALKVPELEYGPGFPVAYFEGETFDEEAYLKEFCELLGGMRNKLPVMLELGRSIAASCGCMLSRVVDLKCNRSGNYAILDSGIHHLAYYGQFMAMKYPLCDLWPPREKSEDDPAWTLCGALCTINDLLVKKLPLHDLKTGDVLIFQNTGAYSMTEGISLFLSRDLPTVVWRMENGKMEVLREQEPTWGLNCGLGL